ncbi:hypothetical protein PybrP1_002582 [[Pythium] brassicae (nom. inval.)]|nr:hypothetical protein PybrP1_002582 [[Pythium] brassicae (nom. inval.)]
MATSGARRPNAGSFGGGGGNFGGGARSNVSDVIAAATGGNAGSAAPGQSNYQEEKAKCITFLQNFRSNLDDPSDEPKYARMLQEVANRERKSVPISLDDIQIFEHDDEFVRRITRNTRRYIALLSEAIDEVLPVPTRDISDAQDVLDVLRTHRARELAQQQQASGSAEVAARHVFPAALMRRFEVRLVPGVKTKAVPIRDVRAGKVGSLVRIKGMVTRVSNVKPLLTVATYTCEACAYEVYQEVNARQFTPLVTCPSERCRANRQNGRLLLQTKASKFDKYQEVKFQELPDQVPMGHIPRSLTVYLRGELTRSCEPGALITICGVFLPLPYSAQRQMQMGLVTETYLEATDVVNHKKRYSAMESSEAMENAVLQLQESGSGSVYEMLSQSIAPEIYGHEDVKKALLLLMIGGVTKRMDEGMRLRGDLNVLLMGDPGVAKSQLLKHISTVAPRGVYTTGKGSSGVGLTAAVNINLPNALLSRFDLLFLLLDVANYEKDEALARHVTYVHRFAKNPAMSFEPVRPEVLRYFIAIAKQYEPSIPEHLAGYIVEAYVTLRQQDVHEHARQQQFARGPLGDANHAQTAMTARQLLSILRLSQALARLRFATEVIHQDVDEAIRLVYVSKASLSEQDEAAGKSSGGGGGAGGLAQGSADATSKIYRMLLEFASDRKTSVVPMSEIEPVVLRKGFTAQQLKACVQYYEELDVMHMSANGTSVSFVM